jgi:AraC family transcriptional regulator, transcriptional activator of pobA
MYKFQFEKEKYGFNLLMDLNKLDNVHKSYCRTELHYCDFFEIYIFENTEGIIELNAKQIEIENYTIFFIAPFKKKRCLIDSDTISGYHIVFQNDFFADFFEDKLFMYRMQYFYNSINDTFFRLNKEDYSLIKTICAEVEYEIKNFQKDSLHIIRSLLYFAFVKLNRLYSKYYQISDETQNDSLIYQFKDLLEQNIRKSHQVAYYCNLLNIQPKKLNPMIKQQFGGTIKEVIQTRLLQEIKMELNYSKKTIAEIASELNFSEANNLTRFFNQLEGISPNAYRYKYQNDRKLY